jgi:predicted CXXCH cytochrome family protein
MMHEFFKKLPSIILLFTSITVAMSSISYAEETDCTACHEPITIGKSVHPALAMGCDACHTAIDPTTVPHKITNKNSRGLSAKMRDLCFGCHDKEPFTKTTVHGAILLGCTSCHNPHASDNAKLLKDKLPVLCITCHEDGFSKGKGHALAGHEACMTCHNPHSTDAPKLVKSVNNEPSPKQQARLSK